jgi:hypothetical protein
MPEVKLQGFVGINSDDEYLLVPQPDTTLGQNISIQTDVQREGGSVKPRLGDLFKCEISPVSPSSKVYEIRTSSSSVHLKIVTPAQQFVLAEASATGPFALQLVVDELSFLTNQYPSLVGSSSYVLFDVEYLIDNQGPYIRISLPAFVGQGGIATENPNRYFDYDVVAGNDEAYSIVCTSDNIYPSMGGDLRVIGSVDHLGNTFVFSTTEDRRPSSIKAQSVTYVSAYFVGPNIVASQTIVELPDHGLSDFDAVSIAVSDNRFYSGTYSVTVIDPDRFYLNGYPYTVQNNGPIAFQSTDCVVVYNPIAIGQIGVLFVDVSGQEQYIPLLTSPELNFRTYHQIDVDAEAFLNKIALYFTDFNNDPRVFYYAGDFVENGALEFINPQNPYKYGTIAQQTRLVSAPQSLTVRFVEQLQTGGTLFAGNKRYVARGVSADLTPGFWSEATGVVPVYTASTIVSPRKIKGNTTATQTEKVNVIEVSGIDTSIYFFVEIGVIEYLDSGYEAVLLNRVALNGRSSLLYYHDGKETERLVLPAQEFNIDDRSVKKALNVCILDNRLLLSNVEFRSERGLEAVLDTVKYRLKHFALPKQGRELGQFYFDASGLDFAEYQKPENVSKYIGYMPNETYLFAARFVFKNGSKSKPVPFCTVKFDTESTSADGRRLEGLPSYDTIRGHQYNPASQLYDKGEILINHIEFSSFNFNAIIDGVPARDIIERIEIMRAEVVNPTVLGCGLAVLAIRAGAESLANTTYPVYRPTPFVGVPTGFGPLFFDPGYMQIGLVRQPDVASLYIPDFLYTGADISSVGVGAKLVVFGSHDYNAHKDSYVQAFGAPPTAFPYGGYIHYGGDSGWGGAGFSPVEYGIDEFGSIADDGFKIFAEGSQFPFIFRNRHFILPNNNRWTRNLTVRLDSPVLTESDHQWQEPDTQGGETFLAGDRGLRYVQIYRPNPDQYNDIDITSAIYTLASISPSDTFVDVFGGDCMYQRTTLKLMSCNAPNVPLNTGAPVCVDFYSHNRINVQLRGSDENIDAAYPMEFDTISQWMLHPFFDEIAYSRAYTPRQEAQSKLVFNPNLPDDTKQPTTIVYSPVKTRGSVQDSYRQFSYADFTSLDTTFGPIVFMRPFNGELITLQERRAQRQFFNTRGVLTTSDGATALIGDGAAFYRDGSTLSSFGCRHKWSVVVGRSFGGNDVWYWYDDVNRVICRFGADGLVPISSRAKFRTEIRSLTELASDSFTPADVFGISGVWDEALSEVVWSFKLARGYRGHWTPGLNVKQGELYSVRGRNYLGVFEDVPVLYRAIFSHEASSLNGPDSDDPAWQEIPYGDPSYMKFFGLVFSESQNRFISVDEIYPAIFIANNRNVYYPRAKAPYGLIYKRNAGEPLVFYDYFGDRKTVFGAVESVFNIDANIQKKAAALRVNCTLVPHKIEVRTELNQTFILAEDFKGRLNQWDSPVNKDSQDEQSRKQGEGGIYGTYVRVKFIFAPEQHQRLINMVLKFRPVSRMYTT